MGMLEHKKLIKRQDVEETLGISQSSAGVLLREMVEKGLLRKNGSGKLVRYAAGEVFY